MTNRHLAEDFLPQVEKVAAMGIQTIILREKDLKAAEYEKLAREVLLICEKYQTKCMLHSFSEVAEKLWQDKTIYQPAGLHLPIGKFLALTEEQKKQIPLLGVSVHSLDEAKQCERLGASYFCDGLHKRCSAARAFLSSGDMRGCKHTGVCNRRDPCG